ncbi:MAG: ATP-binding protein [Treponema sp.]|jgi:anti-sigma regulatory factor (Ser/Thr protein kinase)|nr:ATP-binding protein [Treponema sp.]
MGRRRDNIQIEVDSASPLFDKTGLEYQEFPSDYSRIRFYATLVAKSAPQGVREINILEQQISEIIKNAIKHGNKNDIKKKVRIWHKFTPDMARLIVEDEGEGFKDLEKWNAFNRKRYRHADERNYDELGKYASFRNSASDEFDGGNALFAAVEYWDAGLVFNEKRNAVAMKRLFKPKGAAPGSGGP